MSLHTINRMSEDKFGTGLPIYTKKEYQVRRPNLLGDSITTSGNEGFWICPSNKLPTLQFLHTGSALSAVELIQVCCAEDIATTKLSLSVLKTQDINIGTVYYTTDEERKFNICEGMYYLRIELNDGTNYFSEVFTVSSICVLNNKLDFSVLQVLPDNSANVEFSLFASSENDIQTILLDVGGTLYNDNGVFTQNMPDGSTTIKLTVVSAVCGTYEQTYSFVNNSGVSFELIKQY